MKPRLILCLTLILGGGLFVCRGETNALISSNALQNSFTIKSNWADAKVTLYRIAGGPLELNAKRETVTWRYAQYTNDVEIVAFVDPTTGDAWLGHSFGFQQTFFLETESGIRQGALVFATMALGGVMPYENNVTNGSMAFAYIYWDGSFVEKLGRGKDANAVIDQFTKTNDLKSVATGLRREGVTLIEDSLHRVENDLNPWLFVPEGHGSQFKETTIEAINASDGELRLDLKNPAGTHTACVWVDLKTWKVVKVIQDGKPYEGLLKWHGFPTFPPITNANPSITHQISVHVPTKLKIERTADTLSVTIDANSFEFTNLMVGTNMVTGVESKIYVYPEGESRPTNAGLGLSGGLDFNLGVRYWHTKQDGIPLPGKKYIVEMDLTAFETDIPPQHDWEPNGKNYKVLWRQTSKQTVE